MGRILRVILVGGSLLFLGAFSGHVTAASGNPAPAVARTVTDTITQAIASEDLHRETLARLEHAGEWKNLSQQVAVLELEFDALSAGAMNKPDLINSVELDRQLRGLHRETTTIVERISTIVRRLEHDDKLLESNVKTWQEHATFLEKQSVPSTVIERAMAIIAKLEQANVHVREFRDNALLGLDRAIFLQTRIEDARALVLTRQTRLDSQRLVLEQSPIWQLGTASTQFQLVGAKLSASWQMQQEFLLQDGARLVVLFFFILILSTWLLTRRAGETVEPTQCAYGRPLTASFLLALVALGWLASDPPRLFFELLVLLTPIPAALVASRATKAPIPLTLYGIALSTMLYALRDMAEASPIADRLLMLLQVICVALPVAIDLHRGQLQKAFLWPGPGVVRAVALLVLVGAVLTAFYTICGFAGPAGSVRAGMGSLLGSVLVFGTTAVVLEGLALALLATPLVQWFHSARNADPALLRALRFTIRTFAIISLVIVALGSLGLALVILSAIDLLMGAKLDVGTVSIAFKSVALALGVIFATGFLTSTIGFLLSREVIPRLKIGPGAAYAVIKFTRWSLLIFGAVLTLAALGIDMAKITLLAGALSVGIGFGLQNVINNFVSGLILIIERPIGVGDVIEWGSQSGTITHIGIRSSTVRTEQGAEILVPNGDLVSKDVVNWTRSDRQRRYDVDVEVSSGSDPKQVMQLLAEAATEVPEVMKKPSPHVEFKSFGATSLKFTLHAWMEAVGEELNAQNTLRVAMLNKLVSAGIAPFAEKSVEIHPAKGLAPAVEK